MRRSNIHKIQKLQTGDIHQLKPVWLYS